MHRPPKSAEIGVLRPGRSHIQAAFAPMAEEEGDIGLLSAVLWTFLAQCDHFLNNIEFVKDLSLRTKTCDKFLVSFWLKSSNVDYDGFWMELLCKILAACIEKQRTIPDNRKS